MNKTHQRWDSLLTAHPMRRGEIRFNQDGDEYRGYILHISVKENGLDLVLRLARRTNDGWVRDKPMCLFDEGENTSERLIPIESIQNPIEIDGVITTFHSSHPIRLAPHGHEGNLNWNREVH